MPVHLHHQSSQQAKTRTGNLSESQPQSADNPSQPRYQETQLQKTTVPSSNDLVALFNPDIHICDIGDFAQIGFDCRVQQLANATGFQASIIQNVYKNLGTRAFAEADEVVKAMQKAVQECAEDEIGKRTAGE